MRIGLIEPPPPKIKMSNFMKILSKEAAADPSKVEREVRNIIDERVQHHLD
jgi:U4/U6 small nuclear ribonucleoprotein PRP3